MSTEVRSYFFVVPGPPVSKGRPRMTKAGHVYTPKKTVNLEAHVRDSFYRKYPEATPFPGAVAMLIRAYAQVPMSSRKKDVPLMRCGKIQPVTRPDLDNLTKAIFDALSGYAFKNDSYVVRLEVEKFYVPIEADGEGTSIQITEKGEMP